MNNINHKCTCDFKVVTVVGVKTDLIFHSDFALLVDVTFKLQFQFCFSLSWQKGARFGVNYGKPRLFFERAEFESSLRSDSPE